MTCLVFGYLCCMLFSAGIQDAAVAPKLGNVPSCSQVRCRGKRVGHCMGQFAFCVPRGMKFRRVEGFEGDIHDRITLRVDDEISELVMFTANATWGPVKSRPDDWPSADQKLGTTASDREWQCSEGSGRDFRFDSGGRSWRLLTFPMGFAEYKHASPKAARKFDHALDSLCCQKFNEK